MPGNPDELDKLKVESETRKAVAETLQSEAVEEGFKTAALVKARLEAYKTVAKNFTTFIVAQSRKLEDEDSTLTPFYKLSLARLVAQWMFETERFLDEHEGLLSDVEKKVRRGFVEESLAGLPEDIKQDLVQWMITKKKELLDEFAKELQKANKIAQEREDAKD